MHHRCRTLDPPDALTKLREKSFLRNHVPFLFSLPTYCQGRLAYSPRSRKPFREAARRFANILGRAGERKADPSPAVDRIKIEARGHRDPGLDQQTPAKPLAVARHARNIDIEVERSLGRSKVGEPASRESADQQIAISAVARDMAVELGAAAKGRHCSKLRQRRWGDVEILCQALDRAGQIRRYQHPAQPPS